MLCAFHYPFSGLDRRLGERVALVDLLQFCDRRDLADQTTQQGVARGGERAIVRRHRIMVHKGKSANDRAQLVMRPAQQVRCHDIRGGADLRGIKAHLAERRPVAKAASQGEQQQDRGGLQECAV